MLVKTHYRQRPVPAVAEQTGVDELTIAFDEPQPPLPQNRPPSSTRATSSWRRHHCTGSVAFCGRMLAESLPAKEIGVDAKLSFWLRLAVLGCRTPVLELTGPSGQKSGRKATGRSMAPRALGRVMLGGCGKSGGGPHRCCERRPTCWPQRGRRRSLGCGSGRGEAGHRHGVVGAAEEVAGAVADGVQALDGAPSAFSTCMSLFTFTP